MESDIYKYVTIIVEVEMSGVFVFVIVIQVFHSNYITNHSNVQNSRIQTFTSS